MSIIFSMIARENLPNDTVELKGLVYQLLDVVEQQKLLIANQNERIENLFLKNEEQSQQLQTQAQQLTTQSQKIEEQAHQIDQLTHQVNSLKRHRFGKRSEKIQEDDSKQNDNNTQASSPDAHDLTLDKLILKEAAEENF
ncbi:MAG: transposase [Alphaproteobacteria bacterium]|nr:transposase [Alphaproteobacteria bacterium]